MAVSAFKYKAIDGSGRSRRGLVNARSEDAAFHELSERGLSVLSISAAGSSGLLRSAERVSHHEIAQLTREIHALLEANIPLARGLLSIGEHEKNKKLRDMIIDIASMIESGEKITAAFSKYREVFGDVYIETLRSAERSGRMAQVAEHLADMLERGVEMRQQVKRAMSYPIIVMGFVAMALSVIVIFVVPRFARIFESNGVELPLTTRVVRAIGTSMTSHWWVYLLVVSVAAFGLIRAWRSERGRFVIERLMMRTPYLGKLMAAVTTARFSSVLGIGLDSGIEVIDAIEIASVSTGRPVFVAECEKMCNEMRSGTSLEDVINTSRSLPSFARRLLGSGKDSSEMARASSIIAKHYDRMADHLTKNINTIVEPMITIAMAGIVLLIALSVFLPMWQMISINK